MVVRDGENGVIVPERDSKALARAIEVLLEDPILRQRMGQASRRLALSEFDEKRIVAQYLDLYQKLGVVPQAAASCREHQVAADEGETH
jgi:glycosyltransferase involved in cell wall biosynthesis